MTDDAFLAALALVRALEADPPHDRIAAAVIDEWGTEAIATGLVLVCAVLRQELLRHSARLTCDCGSQEWLERLVFAHAEKS